MKKQKKKSNKRFTHLFFVAGGYFLFLIKKDLQIQKNYGIISKLNLITFADMAELADAHGSGPCESNFMQVQVREPFLRE